jgi:CheY-like chemotaxis protein
MDLKLPVMGGLDATRIIREINPGLPIIAITAYAMDADKQKALQAGCAAYLSKPYSKEELMKLLNKFLG